MNLIERVRAVNPDAVELMIENARKEWPEIDNITQFIIDNDFELSNLFVWDGSPEGHDYWYNICKELGEC